MTHSRCCIVRIVGDDVVDDGVGDDNVGDDVVVYYMGNSVGCFKTGLGTPRREYLLETTRCGCRYRPTAELWKALDRVRRPDQVMYEDISRVGQVAA